MDLTVLVDYIPQILIFGGIVAMAWFLEKIVKPVPVVGTPVSWLTKILALFGFFVGILLIVTGGTAWQTQATIDTYTKGLLIVAGLALFLKPIKDFPWAALIGLIAGSLCAGAVYFFFPLPETVFGFASIWAYVIIFLVPAVIVYMVFKFIEDVLKIVGTILSSRPVTFVVGAACIAQGILLLLDQNLFNIIFG